MSYKRPNAFVNIQLAEPAVAPSVPSYYPTMIGPHFFVAYKEEVTESAKKYYDGIAVNAIPYPQLPNQSVDTGEKLHVDIGDLSPGANDATGSPNVERFDPDVFVVTDDGAEVDISLAEDVNVTASNFSIPANIIYNPSTGAYLSTKGDIVDALKAAAGVGDWTALSSTNDPALSKDDTEADYNTTQALLTALNTAPDVGDGVVSTAFGVTPGEVYTALIRSKSDGVQYTVQVYDETNGAVIVEQTGLTNTNYALTSLAVTIPADCQQVTIRQITEAATGSAQMWLAATNLRLEGSSALRGQILVSYRALSEEYTGARLARLEAGTLADLKALFGTHGLTPANPLGFAMYQAWRHTGLTVRAVAVGNPAEDDGSSSYTGALTDEVLAYTASFDFINQSPDDYYTWMPTTFNEAVWDVMVARLTSLAGTDRQWHRGVVAGQISTTSEFLRGTDGKLMGAFTSATVGGFSDGDTITYSGADYTVHVVDGVSYVALPLAADTNNINFTYGGTDYADGAFTVEDAVGVTLALTSAEAPVFTAAGYKQVKINDTVTIGTGNYTVFKVRPDILVMSFTSGVENAAGLNKTYLVFRYLTLDGTADGKPDKTTMAEQARDRAKAYAEERLIITLPGWVSDTVNNVETDVEGWYVAAQLAAEMCYPIDLANDRGPGYPVGLGFTGLREAKTKTFKSVRYFTQAQLDIIADGGNTLIVNSNPGERLESRHSLTTDRSSIEMQEIMLGTARDYGSYMYRDTLQSMVKRYRVADGLDAALIMRLNGVRRRLIGTEVVFQDTRVTEVAQGATPDSVSIKGEMAHIYPLNYINVNMNVVQPVPFTVTV